MSQHQPRRHLSQIGAIGAARSRTDKLLGERGYPRPQLERETWASLDGKWDFAIDVEASVANPSDVTWGAPILVPFSPETRASGIEDMGLYKAVWYKRTFDCEPLRHDERLILHFGAVDYVATIWIDGQLAAHHEGGYTPIEVDATPHLAKGTTHEIVVRAEDDPLDMCKPRGKQDWRLEPHSIWYPRTTGIWQSVWYERVCDTHISSLQWACSLEKWELGLEANITNPSNRPLRMRVELACDDLLLARDEYMVVANGVQRRIALSDPGIDDFRNELLWSPESPKLIHAEVQLLGEDGKVLDEVKSYTAIRSFTIQGDKIVLNGRPYPLRLILDQGYWNETGLTAPNDEALKRDVLLAKQMGFNGVRKHQKLEDPRYLFWADKLGLLVWEEMPSAYRFTRTSVERMARQWLEALDRDMSHPCIVAWVPFNESWGVPNLPQNEAERQYVRALYHLTRTFDPSRPVVGNDGWESVATDIIGIHDYDDDARRLARRYFTHDVLPKLLARERPGGRAIVIDRNAHPEVPIVLSEFGGIAFARKQNGEWGYSRAKTEGELAQRYKALLATVTSLELLAGFCYTQFADTFQEANGLLYADRTPKFPIEEIRAATSQMMPTTTLMDPVLGREGAP